MKDEHFNLVDLAGLLGLMTALYHTINTVKKQPWKHLFSC